MSSRASSTKQKAFIEGYEKLLNSLGDDEAALFADAVHPTHAARPVGCWAPSQEKLAIEQTSGRQRINIHGCDRPGDRANPDDRGPDDSTLPRRSGCCNRSRRSIRCWRSSMFSWTTRVIIMPSSCRIGYLCRDDVSKPHFIPTYCPHLNPIERLWGLMHRNVTHNKCYATCASVRRCDAQFSA